MRQNPCSQSFQIWKGIQDHGATGSFLSSGDGLSRNSKSDHVILIFKTLQSLLTDLGIKSGAFSAVLPRPVCLPAAYQHQPCWSWDMPHSFCLRDFGCKLGPVPIPYRMLLVGSWPLFRAQFKWHPSRMAFLDGPAYLNLILPPTFVKVLHNSYY